MFLDILKKFSPILSYLLIFSGILLFAIYLVKKNLLKGNKEKYNLISRYEKRVIWNSTILWLAALLIHPKKIISDNVNMHYLLDFFIILILTLSIAYAAYYILKHYYPDYINRRLNRLRYKPRISPKTGKPMKLLTEEEEDVYLDEGMQAEEDVFSVDYDVWIDEETGYTQIEKYSGKYAIKQCPKCNYQTFKIEKEELLIAPTVISSGELLKRYRCTYCDYTEKEIFNVVKLKEEK